MAKCAYCDKRLKDGHFRSANGQTWCDFACAAARQRELQQQARDKKRQKIKAPESPTRAYRRLEDLTRGELYDKLQGFINQWIVHVRDKDEPCCTCGTTKQGIQYDAGHYRSRGACSELRFELTNIHKQCNQKCNVYGSGKRAEYIDFLANKYGQDHLDWLDGKHPLLKEQFPHESDIIAKIKEYRSILRREGLKPRESG